MQIHFKLSSVVLHFEDNQINQKELREKTNIRLEWKKSSKNKTMSFSAVLFFCGFSLMEPIFLLFLPFCK